ncbi:spore germination protein [Paenibacillus curdlanolyticus YK9]|uniref:Spore germination protein n=1 Tax=Paenibacillus curdlanolyticus YK9 TaxID=717606 RepID=E0I8A9_9BACL|nr:endospore germination permease [Paenibacillus curdlanolyticus]EFM11414.1 spore germination protein [Paenibacillus curdlanolyticus YK9]
MLEKGKIGARQLTILAIFLTIGDSILALPATTAIQGKQDAWLSGVIGLAIGIPIVYLIAVVGKLYPGMTVFMSSRKILGKWLGLVASLLFAVHLFLNASVFLREIGDFVTSHMMPETPIQSILLLFLCIIVMGTKLGLEVIARTGELLFPFFVFLFLFFVVALAPKADLVNVQPFLEDGFRPLLRGTLAAIAYPYVELAVLLMVIPYVSQVERIGRSMLLGGLLGGIAVAVVLSLSILVLGAGDTARHLYPSYALAQEINIGEFLDRVEAVMAILWFFSIYFKLTIYFYGMTLGLAQLAGLKETRILMLPMGMLLLIGAITVSPNTIFFNQLATYWSLYDMTYVLGFLLLLLAVHAIRGKGSEEQSTKIETSG